MNLKSPGARALGVIALLLLLMLYARSERPERSAMQSHFDRWLAQYEQEVTRVVGSSKSGSQESSTSALAVQLDQRIIPILTLRFHADDTAPEKTLTLQASQNSDELMQTLRVLQLMREADIFSLPEKSLPSTVGSNRKLSLTVQNAETNYSADFNEGDVAHNVQAQVLLKLFEEYAQHNAARTIDKGATFDTKA